MSVLNDPKLEFLLDELHTQSKEQDGAMEKHFSALFADGKEIVLDAGETKSFLADKLVALERDKAEFCYAMCRALGAKRIVEAGTSFGVSTLYLAAAIRDNCRDRGGKGVVIGTEYEPDKAKAARETFSSAGLSEFIELREGDLRQTLRDVSPPIDFMLIDIWIPMALPALELVAPRLRTGAVVICDNTEQYREAYHDYFAFLQDARNGFRTLTLPFAGGLEFSLRCV